MSMLPDKNTVSCMTQAAFIPFMFSYLTWNRCLVKEEGTEKLWKTAKELNRLHAYLAMDFYSVN